jgi:hypothetical protein
MVTFITGAGFNANHVESSEKPIRLTQDKIYTLNVELHATSWTFEKGHKIRVSVNNAQWPMIWPSPYPMTTSIRSNDQLKSFLTLPVPINPTPMANPFPKPVAPPPKLPNYKSIASGTISGYPELSDTQRDERTGTTTILARNSGSDQYPWGVRSYTELVTYTANDVTPALSSVLSTYTTTVQLKEEQKDQGLKWTGILDFSSDEKTFYYKFKRILEKNGEVIREKEWQEEVPRLW